METNLNQCCASMHSICDTCRKVFVCPMQHIEHREKCGLYEPLPNPLDEIVNENTTRSLKPINQYKEENVMETRELVEQTSIKEETDAWKIRLKEEYAQLKERYEKLRIWNVKRGIESRLGLVFSEKENQTHLECRKEDVREDIMHKQEQIMKEYLRVLEERMALEGIEL